MIIFPEMIYLIIILQILNTLNCVDSNGFSFDDDVMDNLLNTKKYNKLVRPDGIVNVNFQLSYRQLVSLDEKTQIMTSNIYLYANWYDSRLSWNPDDFDGLNDIVIPANKIWLPDFAILNSAGTSNFVSITDSNIAILYSDGYVYLTISIPSLQTRCKINIFKFPFDTQNCSIIIGSWQLDNNRIDFASDDDKISTSDFVTHGVWILNRINVRSIVTSGRYRYGDSYNEDIAFDVIIKRRPLYYMTTFIPCYILNVATLLAYFVTNQITIQVNLCNLFINLFLDKSTSKLIKKLFNIRYDNVFNVWSVFT